MRLLRQLGSFVSALLRRGRVEESLADEIDFHVNAYAGDLERSGVPRVEAERRARREFGNATHVREECRQARGMALLDDLRSDLRYAARMLRRNPVFAGVAILSLGFGLGANTAIFSLVNTVMLKSLPVADVQRLFFIDNSGGKSHGSNAPPYPCYERLRDQSRYFSGMSAFARERFKVTIDGVQSPIAGQYASGSYYQVLGLQAAYGRLLTPADDSEIGQGGPDGAVAVISYGLWQRRFGQSPDVLGRKIQVGTVWVTIVGVTPPGFFGLEVGAPVDVTVPMALTTTNLRARMLWWFSAVGRLREGATVEQARAELDQYFQSYMEEVGMRKAGRRTFTTSYFDRIVLIPAALGLDSLRNKFSKPLVIVMAIVGLVLLIGCANVANLLLARASARRNEIAMRLAIGAGRGRLVRQMFTEGLLLVAAAAAVGIGMAKFGVTLLVNLFAGVRGRIVLEPRFDGRVVAFTAAVALLTGILFSIAPALHAARAGAAGLVTPGRAGRSRLQSRLGNALVVAQIMLSMVLLCGAALFVRTLQNLSSLDAGFQREGVLTMQVDATLPRTGGPPTDSQAAQEESARLGRMWEDLIGPAGSLPGVRAASISTLSPMSGHNRGVLMNVGGEPDNPNRDRGIKVNQVSAGYFDALGVGLVGGRLFTTRDQGNSARVAILNERAAAARFPNMNPLGRRITFPGQPVTAEYEIVGVVRDTRYESLRKQADAMVYLPVEQAIDRIAGVVVAVRVAGGSAEATAAIRRQARTIVPGGFISNVATVQQQVDESLLEERLLSILATIFGGLALLLAAIGLYGMMAYTVIGRTREIGIRIAVGARRGAVMWLVLRHTFGLIGIGLALAVPVVVVVSKYVQSELYGLAPGDPVALAGAMLVLVGVAAAAGYRPAWKASRVDPMVSLRYE